MSLAELLDLHEKCSEEFRDTYGEVCEGGGLGGVVHPSYLDLKITIAYRLLKSCVFCERRCKVDRVAGGNGFCRLDSRTRVASAFLHMGEEAPLVPSGTIFFTSCSFRCVFCQNWDISTRPENGVVVSPRELAELATRLYMSGARNINYVGGNPDQQLHTILCSLRYMDVNVPLLWNSNMYMSLEALQLLADIIDIWLPDFKYGNDECARRLSGVENYFAVVSRNHSVAYAHGDMIIRHLVLPGHVECCSKPVLRWIADNCPSALVNIMDQYRPEYKVAARPNLYPDIARRVSEGELEEVYSYADSLGICWRPVS